MSDDSYYDVGQICVNGHVVNSMSRSYPRTNATHCDKCGAKTIDACPQCGTAIRGFYHVPGVIGFGHYSAPSFCFNCGQPFPWTQAGLDAARELVGILDGLNASEREELSRSLDDLVRETPRTPVAQTRFKAIMRKAGKEGYEGIKSVLTDIVSETVRKTIFGA